MNYMFVNLKRFDIPFSKGGICPEENSEQWIDTILRESMELGLSKDSRVEIVYILPEGLLLPAKNLISSYGAGNFPSIDIGCQGVYRKDVAKGGNFGAFTTFLPATAAAEMGCTWAMVGHSEERQDYYELLSLYDTFSGQQDRTLESLNKTIHSIINDEATKAFQAGLNVLFCLGETQEEKGSGSFEEQKGRLRAILHDQVEIGLKGLSDFTADRKLVIGYEPRWAIGPGKTPPGPEYISFVADIIKEEAMSLYGLDVDIVYGGGLKRENAGDISSVESLSGGLVALTKFTQPIGFSTSEFKVIIDMYLD